jgi:hypothetical protein
MRIQYRILINVVIIGLALAVWSRTPSWYRPKVYSVASGKVVSYLAGKNKYRLVFAGDSRTFTDIQPRVIDSVLGRRSYNLASFGLWMPVQYVEFQEVFPHVPRDTVVVWSLSHHNFTPIGDRWWIPGQYKFSLADVAEYIRDGYPVRRMFQEYDESPYSPIDLAVRARKQLMGSMENVVWKAKTPPAGAAAPQAGLTAAANEVPAPAKLPSRAEVNEAEAARVIAVLQHDRKTNFVSRVIKDGIVTSVESTRSDGGYDRIIIDHDFFKKQQALLWPRRAGDEAGCHFVANEAYMRTFGKILELLARYHMKVIVNYIEDAPGSWPSDAERRCAKQFMLAKIVPMLSERGIDFTSPDFYSRIDFSNDLYFDESHLTTEGAAIYSEILASEIAKILARRGW